MPTWQGENGDERIYSTNFKSSTVNGLMIDKKLLPPFLNRWVVFSYQNVFL